MGGRDSLRQQQFNSKFNVIFSPASWSAEAQSRQTPADESKHVVVEVTPRSRRLYDLPFTTTLQKQILHKRVVITGWLFYDSMRTANAANTNPNGKNIWRATCEEIHPVTGIKVLHQ